MKCPTCARKIGPGTRRCMYCGAKIGAAEPTRAAPTAPEAAPLPPLRMTSGHIRPRRSWGTAAVLLVLAVAAAAGAWAYLRPEEGGDVILIRAGDVHVWTREVRAPCGFRFTVTSVEGDCAASSGPIRSAAGVSPAEKEALDAQAAPVRAGDTRVFAGTCAAGPYAWAVFASRKSGARVRVSFDFK